MNKSFLAFRLALVLIAALGGAYLVAAGCGVAGSPGLPSIPSTTASLPNPAAPPAPPAEVPSALVISDPVISVEKTRSDGSSNPDVSALVGSGPLQDAISFSSNIVDFTQQFLQDILAPLKGVLIPVGTGVTHLQTILSPNVTAFLDFANFKYNGTDAPCSGNTRELPICMRVWIDQGDGFAPYLSAVFTDYPREGNPGAGLLRAFSGGFNTAVNYNHSDPNNKISELFYGFFLPDSSDPENPDVAISIHAIISQLGPDETALKTVNGNNFASGSGFGLGRWREDGDLWKGSLFTQDEGGNTTGDFQNICAVISSASEADPQGLCADSGISSEDLSFLPLAAAKDLLLYDFPALPPE